MTNRELAEAYWEAVETGQTCDKVEALERLLNSTQQTERPKVYPDYKLRVYIQHHPDGQPDGNRPYVSCFPPSEGMRREMERKGYLFFEALVPLPGVWGGGEMVKTAPVTTICEGPGWLERGWKQS
jgi:hypothetical protein